MKKLSIVVPVYNEEHFIAQTLEAITAADSGGLQKEIVIIDDVSKDQTVEVINNFLSQKANSHNLWKTIFKEHNQGKGAALKDGFLATTGDIVIIQDADLEYNPEEYPILLEPFLKEDADVVYGSRLVTNRPHRILYFWHYQVNLFLTTFSNMLTNLNLTDMETGYKCFKGDLIRAIAPKLVSQRFGFEPEITARIAKVKAIKIYEVGISYKGRTYAEGKKINWKDGIKAFWEIIKYNLLTK